MKVVAVVLNWRRPSDTIACLDALRANAPGLETIVVDNGSGDGAAQRIASAHPWARMLELPENLGYAGGNNAGIAEALRGAPDAVLVLNNDVLVEPGCVESLTATLAASPDAAIVSPVSLGPDRKTLDFFTGVVDVCNAAVGAPGRDEPWPGAPSPVPTDYATGSALLIRAADAAGGPFDEDFFLVWEDVDLALRLRAQGRMLLADPAARVVHHGSVSFGGAASPLYQYFFARNSFLIVRKHVRWPRRTRTLRMLERRYRVWAERSDHLVARAIERGLDDGLAQRFGPPPPGLLPA